MISLYDTNNRTWAEMTPAERKICLIIVGIMLIALIGCGIYEYFKNKRNK